MTRRVVLATKNPDKIPEIEAALHAAGLDVEVVRGADWPDVEETGASLEENALLKARAAATATGVASIGDDTGLEVDALDGAPGVRTARFAGPDATYAENRAALLAALDGVEDRSARFRTVVALVAPEGTEVVVGGTLEGRIATEERGSGGFGYDSVFEVGQGRTLAELGSVEKGRISHRAQAVHALAEALGRGEQP